MTDKEKLQSILADLGINFREDLVSHRLYIEAEDPLNQQRGTVDGYGAMWNSWEFDSEGKFVRLFMGE